MLVALISPNPANTALSLTTPVHLRKASAPGYAVLRESKDMLQLTETRCHQHFPDYTKERKIEFLKPAIIIREFRTSVLKKYLY